MGGVGEGAEQTTTSWHLCCLVYAETSPCPHSQVARRLQNKRVTTHTNSFAQPLSGVAKNTIRVVATEWLGNINRPSDFIV